MTRIFYYLDIGSEKNSQLRGFKKKVIHSNIHYTCTLGWEKKFFIFLHSTLIGLASPKSFQHPSLLSTCFIYYSSLLIIWRKRNKMSIISHYWDSSFTMWKVTKITSKGVNSFFKFSDFGSIVFLSRHTIIQAYNLSCPIFGNMYIYLFDIMSLTSTFCFYFCLT